ncbi:MAG: hypothetical protein N2042_07755, partial [Thermodesulfovibrio sp.]|nr:hypothetical protein [Thermodesulfovibrio sp.]
YLFPLYLYQKSEPPKRKQFTFGPTMMLFEPQAEYLVKTPNLNKELIQNLAVTYKKEPTPEEVFNYIYAILYSNIYRTKYAEFLKIDFPRIPFAKNYKLFCKMADYGEELVGLHLLKSSKLFTPNVKFQGRGDNRVEKLRYEDRNLFINREQYFEGITPQIWNYQIGGYKVCEKWLKDRKGRNLTLSEIQTYCKIITSLEQTVEFQNLIDKLYPEVEKEIISFETT